MPFTMIKPPFYVLYLIQFLLLFNQFEATFAVAKIKFKYNTCYYSTTFPHRICSQTHPIQIQHLLLFNTQCLVKINVMWLFKYNTCYYSTLLAYAQIYNVPVFKYNTCYYSSDISYVNHRRPSIQIQHLLLFNNFLTNICIWIKIQIQHLLLFNKVPKSLINGTYVVKPLTTKVASFPCPFRGRDCLSEIQRCPQYPAVYAASTAARLIRSDKVQVFLFRHRGTFAPMSCCTVTGTAFKISRMKYREPIL